MKIILQIINLITKILSKPKTTPKEEPNEIEEVIILSKKDLKRRNFSEDDAFVSSTVYRINHDADPNNDIINYPSEEEEQEVLYNLMSTMDMAQEMRNLLNCPVIPLSLFRCLVLNRLVKSKDDSQHRDGLAIDCTSPEYGSPEDIMKYLHSIDFVVDQCLCEGGWLHVSRLPDGHNRMIYGYYLPDENGDRVFKPIY